MQLIESVNSRIGVGTNLNNRGLSESQLVYVCVTCCIPTLITILAIWKCSILNYITICLLLCQ